MNTSKKKSLHVAVLAGLAAVGVVGTAQAVHINPDGLGQVLIYPYYTARAGQFTAISIINTQNNTKAVKVRFLEGKNSKEVLDFNLFMSPNDVWTGAVVATANGARLVTNDNSCVTPNDLFTEDRFDTLGLPLNAFKNYQYTGQNSDNSDDSFKSLDRTREGYFEVLEMGVVDDNANPADAFSSATATLTGYIKHNSAGVPANCSALDNYDINSTVGTSRFPATPTALLSPPRGGLTGRASIINPATGANYTFSPTAMDAWSNTVAYSGVGDIFPSLVSGTAPPTSNVFATSGGVPGVITANWASGAEAMSGALMRNAVINEFVLDAGTASQTDWVVTFPTKSAFVSPDKATSAAVPPFANNFQNDTLAGACDPYNYGVFNREESSPPPTRLNPSPAAPGVNSNSALCWEANVVPFGTAGLLGSTNTSLLDVALQAQVNSSSTVPGSRTTPTARATQGPNGWMSMNFNTATQVLVPITATFAALGSAAAPTALTAGAGDHHGLPVIGVMMHNYRNSGVVSLYGGVIDHKFTRFIGVTAAP